MPNVSSPLGTANDAVPLINVTQLAKAAGVHIHFPTLAALNAAVAAERVNVGASSALYTQGQPFTVATEGGAKRTWDTTGQHARTVHLPGGRAPIVLPADSGTVAAVSAAPTGGNDGDLRFNAPSGVYYVKASGSWTSAIAYVLTQANASPVGGVTSVPFNGTLTFDGDKDFGIVYVNGATPLTVDLTGAVRNGNITGTFVTNGVNTPTVTGAVLVGGSQAYPTVGSNSAGVPVRFDAWYDGLKTYFQWSYDASNGTVPRPGVTPAPTPAPTSATPAPTPAPTSAPAGGAISWTSPTFAQTNGSSLQVILQRVGGDATDAGAHWFTTDGTAVAGVDYQVQDHTEFWGNPDYSGNKGYSIQVLIPNTGKTFTVTIDDVFGPSNPTIGSPSVATCTC